MSATSHGQLKKHPAIIEPFTIPFDTEVQCIMHSKVICILLCKRELRNTTLD